VIFYVLALPTPLEFAGIALPTAPRQDIKSLALILLIQTQILEV
jgi:hypothetical protein